MTKNSATTDLLLGKLGFSSRETFVRPSRGGKIIEQVGVSMPPSEKSPKNLHKPHLQSVWLM